MINFKDQVLHTVKINFLITERMTSQSDHFTRQHDQQTPNKPEVFLTSLQESDTLRNCQVAIGHVLVASTYLPLPGPRAGWGQGVMSHVGPHPQFEQHGLREVGATLHCTKSKMK